MTTKAGPDDTRVQLTSDEVRQASDVSQWFDNEIKIPSQAQTLLERYAGLAPDEVIPHVAQLVR